MADDVEVEVVTGALPLKPDPEKPNVGLTTVTAKGMTGFKITKGKTVVITFPPSDLKWKLVEEWKEVGREGYKDGIPKEPESPAPDLPTLRLIAGFSNGQYGGKISMAEWQKIFSKKHGGASIPIMDLGKMEEVRFDAPITGYCWLAPNMPANNLKQANGRVQVHLAVDE